MPRVTINNPTDTGSIVITGSAQGGLGIEVADHIGNSAMIALPASMAALVSSVINHIVQVDLDQENY